MDPCERESTRDVRYPRRRTDLTIHELDGEALIFDPQCGDTHRLNQTALLIWRSCDGGHDAESIARVLTDEYEVARTDAQHHVDSTLTRLHECALLAKAIADPQKEDE